MLLNPIIAWAIIIGAVLYFLRELIRHYNVRCNTCGTPYAFHHWDEKAYCPNKECSEYENQFREITKT